MYDAVYDQAVHGHVNLRNAEEEIAYEHPEIPSRFESLVTLFLLPLIVYGGFGRSVMMYEKRSTLLLMSHAQELLLHTLPLGLIIYINVNELQKVTVLDIFSFAFLGANVVEVFIETCVLRLYENWQINLELRGSMKSQPRTVDLFKVSIVSGLFLMASIMVGFFAVPKGKCIQGQFLENNICKKCVTYVDPSCVACSNRFACDECQVGYFGIDKDCISCKQRFGEMCLECTAGGCTKCRSENFLRFG